MRIESATIIAIFLIRICCRSRQRRSSKPPARKPELPWEKRARYVADFGVTDYDAAVRPAIFPLRAIWHAAAGARN
jgi:hypothetical protein